MIIKLIALGPREYARDRVNLFDGTIVILTITENIVTLSDKNLNQSGVISGFRAVRLFRIFKLARNLKSF